MKEIISQLIDDFHERELPVPVSREKELYEVTGKASVVTGMRRAGKTWFCYQKMAQLLSMGIQKKKILFLNFEDDRLLEFNIHHFSDVLDVYYAKYPLHKDTKCYFFFDEIQRIDQWEIFIRRLLDTENVQVYLTGSSSKLLSTEIATSLRGRSLTTEIFPFNFSEYLKFHGIFTQKPKTYGTKTASLLRKAVKDYLVTGGFPEVQGLDQHLRIQILQGYMDSVLLKDVIERHNVSNVQVLKYLVRFTMNSPGGKFSVNKFYNTMKSMSIKCTKNSLYEYLDHLIDSFVFSKVPLHSRSEKARLVNPAKIYTIDTGMLNAMTFRNSTDYGPILENMVFMHLRSNGFQVEYIGSSDGYETDFLARHNITGDQELIQVCWDMSNPKTFEREVRGLTRAMKALSINEGTIVTWDDEAFLENGIHVVPVWKWLLV